MYKVLSITISQMTDHVFVENEILKMTLTESNNIVFEQLANLTRLKLINCNVKFNYLPNLKVLKSFCSNVVGLSNLINLTELHLASDQDFTDEDYLELSNLINLEKFMVIDNYGPLRLKTVNVLKNLPNMKWLSVNSNLIDIKFY